MCRTSLPPDDAFVAKRLRDAGAIILGKANLSEFASGLARSSLGGLMKNPHDLTRTPLGSAGGTGISVAKTTVSTDGGTQPRWSREAARADCTRILTIWGEYY